MNYLCRTSGLWLPDHHLRFPPKRGFAQPNYNFLPGHFPAGVVARAPGGVAFAVGAGGHGQDSNNASSYTFSGLSYGLPAGSNRVVGVVEATRSQGGADNRSSVSVGGTTLTNGIEDLSGGNSNNRRSGIAWGIVPSGTSGDVVIDFAGQTQRQAEVWVFSVSILSSLTPVDSDTGSGEPSFTLPAGNSVYFASKTPSSSDDDPTVASGETGTAVDSTLGTEGQSSCYYWEGAAGGAVTMNDDDGGGSQASFSWILLQ